MSAFLSHLAGVAIFVLLVSAPLPWGLWVSARLAPAASLPQTILVVLTTWCAVHASVVHALGALEILRAGPVIGVELLLFAVGCLVALRSAAGRHLRTSEPRRLTSPELVILFGLAVVGSTLTWWSASAPIADWDSWAFHMPPMAEWLQEGRFTRLAQYRHRLQTAYPYGWEAVSTLFLFPFGEDVFVTVPNLVAWVLLGLAVYTLARQWGARREPALAAAALLMTMPGITHPVNSMHVDLAFAAMFTVAATFGVRWARSGSPAAFGLAVAALGLSCACRITGPVYAVALVVWVGLVRLQAARARARGGPRRDRAQVATAIAGVLIGLFLGVFWYVRNLIDLGGIFGPVAQERLARWPAAKGGGVALAATLDPLSSKSWRIVYDRAVGELDLSFFVLVLLAALCPLAWSKRGRERVSLLAPALFAAGMLILFAFTPASAISGIQPRLGFPALAGLAVLSAVGATVAGVRGEALAFFASLTAARSLTSRIVYLAAPLILVWGLRRRIPSSLQRAALPVLVAVALIAGTAVARARREEGRRELHGPAYEHLERFTRADEAVAHADCGRSYFLYGRWLKRPVVFTPIEPGQTIEQWAEELHRRHINLVAIGPYDTLNPEAVANVERLRAPGSPLIAVSGRGDPGEMTLFQLRR